MRALIGFAALLVTLAIIGIVVKQQLRTAGSAAAPTAASGAAGETPQQLRDRIANDAARALEQGAAARREQAEQP